MTGSHKVLAHVSRALRQLLVFALSFDWFTGLSVSFVIGQSDYIGFGIDGKLNTALC